jgi:3-oxoacyl-[acyl-carrier-protein] synthase II
MLKRLAVDRNGDPASACRPFDQNRSGGVVSEGAGLLILEELEHARARGARIYAEVVGFGCSSNCASWTTPQKDGRALRLAMQKALADARMSPEQVELIASFGLGTREHDAAEAAAIHAAFGPRGREVRVLATKGALGYNGAGSGAIDLAAAVAAMQRGVLPPSPNTERVDPDCGLNVVRGDPCDARVGTVLSHAMALSGGQTAALVLRRFAD